MQTLPDLLREGLVIVSIGINPSLPSVAAGFYFANPRNRFWKALNQSGIAGETLIPGAPANERLFTDYDIGFTDLVKRPSAGIAVLRAADYREGAGLLHDKLVRYQPLIAWFQGKEAYRNYLKYTGRPHKSIDWGEQSECIGASYVFVAPNPSPANAAFSLEVLVEWYKALNTLRLKLSDSLRAGA